MNKLLLLLTFFGTVLTAQNVPNYIPTNGLIGWWSFSGNIVDSSLTNSNGTNSGVTYSTDRFGNANSSLFFDGGSDVVVIGSSSMFDLSQGLTVSFFTKEPANSSSGGVGQIFWKANNDQMSIKYLPNTDEIQFWIKHSQSISTTVVSSVGDTNWHHFSCIYDASGNEMKIFKDGSLVDSTSLNSTSFWDDTNHPNINLGNVQQPGTNNWIETFEGYLDDLGIWDRALSDSEVYGISGSCSDSLISSPSSGSFQTVPGFAYFTTSHSDTSATLQWQQNNGTGWSNLSDFGIYSGTSTDSLILTGITTSLNGYGYRCIIDACTMDTTDVAYLTVLDNVGIEESAKGLIVSPNPTSGLISINLARTTMYNVYNMNGQKVAEGNTEGQIDLSNLPSGSYQLLLFTQDGKKTISLQKL